MNPNQRRLFGAAMIIIAITAGLAFVASVFSDNIAALQCWDLKSMKSFAATSTDQRYKVDMEQQIAACEGVDLDALAGAIPDSGSSASPSATATTAAASPSATPKVKHWYDPYDPSKQQFYANWSPKYKNSVNAFGPNKPLAPSLQGEKMEKLNANQAFTEHTYVIDHDAMQTATAMVSLGLTKKDVNALIHEYTHDAKLLKHDRKVVKKKLSGMDRRVFDSKAGTHVTTLRALSGAENGVPLVDSINVTYPVATRWVIYTDPKTGKEYWFRLICKFQPRLFAETTQVPQAPPTQRGITRTHEGTPKLTPTPTPKPTTPSTTSTPKPTTPSTTSTPEPSTPPPTTPPPSPTTVPKDPTKDPAPNGNAGNGGGQNQDPGPGEVTTPTQPPEAPREDPAPPPVSEPTTPQLPSPPAEPGEDPNVPNTPVCVPDPGQDTCD